MYANLTQYGYTKDGKVWLKGYLNFPDRIIGDVKLGEEESLKYFINRYHNLAKKKVEEIRDAVLTNPNKGSYLMKLIHMRTYLGEFDGLGDFPALFQILDDLEEEIRDYISGNRNKNLDIKNALVLEAERLKETEDYQTASLLVKDLKNRWIKTGNAPDNSEEDLNARFHDALHQFFRKRRMFYDELQRLAQIKIDKYMSLIYRMKSINQAYDMVDKVDEVKAIQNEWKEVGVLSKKKYSKIKSDFKREVDRYFNEYKKRKEKPKKTGIELKREFLQKVEAILEKGNIRSMTHVKKIQADWKQIGKLTELEDKDLNLKFRIVCNEIFETHFLEKTASDATPNLYDMPVTDQLKIKIRLIKDSIKKDEADLNTFNEAVRKGTLSLQSPDEINKERSNFINRIKTKQRILKKLQDTLLVSY